MNRWKRFRHNKQPLVSNIETIPIDLIIEILSRLSAKSIAVCRCVSKLWSSLLRSQEFTESFQIRSSTQPRLVFTFQLDGKWHFFSSHQPQTLDKGLSVVVAEYHKNLSRNSYYSACQSVNGFIHLLDNLNRIPVICNPCTGQTLTLPKLRARNKNLYSYFGYDPVNKQFKVLCMTVSYYRQQYKSKEHQVLTFGKGKLSWRKIECLFPHYPHSERDNDSICIDGVLYYIALSNVTLLIACFDVNSEKFSFIEVGSKFIYYSLSNLINYKGKLGTLICNNTELWILDDREKEKWSKHILALPNTNFHVLKSRWASDNGEIVWVQRRWTNPFYVFYCNLERKSVRRVEIKGIQEKILMGRVFAAHLTVTEHIENLMFL